MKSLLASFFRWIFTVDFFRKQYYFFHRRFFAPLHLFRGVKKEVVYRKHFRIQLDLDDWIQQQIYFLGDYEKEEIDFLYSYLKPGNTFIDIGGNIGIFSLNASGIVGQHGKVIAFEAFAPNFEKIKKNIQRNGISNTTLEHCAISDRKGKLEIYYDENADNVGMASSYLENSTLKVEVDSISLDEYLNIHPLKTVDLIKIDIEGGEFLALQGMKNVLKNHQPAIIIEMNHMTMEKSGTSEKEVLQFFSAQEYQLTKVLSKSTHSYNAVFQKVN